MSFYTSVTYYRPRTPPPMTGDDLARFIARVGEINVLRASRGHMSVRFGDAIDSDDRDMSDDEEVAPGVCTMGSRAWDIEFFEPVDHEKMIDMLSGDERRIYRAHIALGAPTSAVLDPITRTNSPENDRDFTPDTLSLEIGPIVSCDLSSELLAHVGWIGMSLSGYGYLYPWTFKDVLQRLEGSPDVQRIMALCGSFWPLPPEPLDRDVITARRQIGRLWPYDDHAKTWDWYWGLQETG